MTESTFGNPTQFELTEITLDGQDIRGLFFSISLYENIYVPVMTGSITIMDSDGAGFIEENRIEFIEPIEFSFKNANGDTLQFKGVCNELRNEVLKDSKKFYTVGFSSEAVRKNEETYVVKAFKDSNPEDIVQEMTEKLGGKLDSKAKGLPMNYIGSRRRPIDVIKYVLTHGVTQESEATEQQGTKEEEAKGTTGFMFWETLDGFKFDTVDNVNAGKAGEEHKDFSLKLANTGASLEESMKTIVSCDFTQIGDFQTKLRSGAFGAKNVSFDMDSGEYKEYYYYNGKNMTEKQRKLLPEGSITRYMNKVYTNQKFNLKCDPAQPSTGDQSRRYLNQNVGRQNTFSDQTGEMTLYPQFKFRAGDSFRAYTRIKTIRSTIQQDDSSSTKS